MAVSTPSPTPTARLWVRTVATTVTSITTVSEIGMARRVDGRMECQSKVAQETNTITATSAAIGMVETTSFSATASTISSAPAMNVEIRVRAPEAFTLIMVCPIIAQPPIPPNSPASTFAPPCPNDSRVLSERVSVTSSTSLAVSSDSSSPTSAIARAYGKITCSVSQVYGTSGMRNAGSELGSSPLSPTVGTWAFTTTATRVTTMIPTSGAGTAVVRRGKRKMTASPSAVRG